MFRPDELTSKERSADLFMSIDPGFVNYRLIESWLPPTPWNDLTSEVPTDVPEGLRRTRINHLYAQVVLAACFGSTTPSLGSLLANGSGRMFNSTIELEPTPDVYEADRVRTRIKTPGVESYTVVLEYSTEHIYSTTTRSELAEGGTMSVIAMQARVRRGELVFYPLVMGAPWLEDRTEKADFPGDPVWQSWTFFETFPEDIDEFSNVKEMKLPSDISVMEKVSELAFKTCLCEILGDPVTPDWGGETSDHYSAHLHLEGKSITAAFLLKGPAKFRPMGLNHLGKNNDQICRLSSEPAHLLVVQHCHEILPAVRKTLRVFAVQPGACRRYCLIDGRESLRLLQAYGKLDRALQLSSR